MAKNNNLQDFVTDIADAIREKKGTEGKINPQDFADEIRDIHEEVDMLGFSKIGYTKDNDGGIQEAVDYAYNLAKEWNITKNKKLFQGNVHLVFLPKIDMSGIPNGDNLFNLCTSLVALPELDTSGFSTMKNFFSGCSALNTVPFMDISNCSYITAMFKNCKSLTSIPQLDFSNVIDAFDLFANDVSLKYLPVINTINATNVSDIFWDCTSLEKIDGFYVDNAKTVTGVFKSCSNLFYVIIYNIGKSTTTTFNFSGATNWGVGSEENRQSLIDSLITYSYDRASAGMATVTITLSENTKALLTEEEIAQITQKGYTIA